MQLGGKRMYRALIVDDDRWVAADVREMLKPEKYGFTHVEVCLSAEEALAILLSDEVYDLVLTDIRMSDMSGLDLIKACRAKKVESLFVLISAYNDFSYVSEAFEYGVFDYLLKPVSSEKAEKLMLRVSAKLEEKYASSIRLRENEDGGPLDVAIRFIQEHYNENISLDDAANVCHLQKNYLSNLISKQLGMSFSQFKNQLRIVEAKRRIQQGRETITEVALSVGYNDLNYFSRIFKQNVGMTPQEYSRFFELSKRKGE